MKKLTKGQSAVLLIFVIGMVGLFMGMSLSKTGFAESLMGRGIANSSYAFYVANSGVEDAFYKIRELDFGNPGPDEYSLAVGDGTAKVKVSGTRDERIIESTGRYNNFVRKIRVVAYNTEIKPGFVRAIQAGMGGVELENTTEVTGRYKTTNAWYPGDVYSNTYIRGVNNGKDGDCSQPAAVSRINGNVWAVTDIEKLGNSDGICVDGNAYAGSIKECRILGFAYSETPISNAWCPYNALCDPLSDPVNCKKPEIEPLPDIGAPLLKQYLQSHGTTFYGDCDIGGANDCTTVRGDGKNVIGNKIITGNLTTTKDFYVDGPIWVQGDIYINSNQTISLVPEITDASLIILASGKIVSDSNVTFTSQDVSFLLLASEYDKESVVCGDDNDVAVSISANVDSILFYAMNGCIMVENPTANSEFYGSILGVGVRIKNNSKIVYDPALQNAKFVLNKDGGWLISSFTEK